ncbi:MAG: ArnT family glycosyltransferase [Planctomycetota bacterium]
MSTPHEADRAEDVKGEGFPSRLPPRLDLPLILLLSAFLLLWGIGGGSLCASDEAFYAVITRDMAESSDFLTTTYLGKPTFHKPPLYMWFASFWFLVTGDIEFSIRFGAALAGMGCVALAYVFGCGFAGRTAGILSALLLLGTSKFLDMGRAGMLDLPLTFFVMAGLWCVWKARERPRFLWGAGAALGLAVMVKGAAAFVLPLAAVCVALADRNPRLLFNRHAALGAAVALAVAAPWHLAMAVSYPGFIEQYLGYHVFQRATSALELHSGPPWFYLWIIPWKFRPWGMLVLPALALVAHRAVRKKEAAPRFTTVWALAVLLPYSLLGTKIAWYVLPAYPALCLGLGQLVSRVARGRVAVLLAVVGAVTAFLHVPFSNILDVDHNPEIKAVALRASHRLRNDDGFFLYDIGELPATGYYFRREARYVLEPDEMDERIASVDRYLVFFRPEAEDLFSKREGVRIHNVSDRFRVATNIPDFMDARDENPKSQPSQPSPESTGQGLWRASGNPNEPQLKILMGDFG